MSVPIEFTKLNEPRAESEKFSASIRAGAYSRQEAIAAAQKLTGMVIDDIGNTKDQELFYALDTLVGRKFNNLLGESGLSPDTSHIVIGHAGGSGNNWFFLGTNERVTDRINKHVPQGEKAWVVACKSGEERHFSMLHGEEVISNGPRQKIAFKKM